MPMPTMARVSASPSRRRGDTGVRLKAMASPPLLEGEAETLSELVEGVANMLRPGGIGVSFDEPRLDDLELALGWTHGQAVATVEAAVAQREELAPEQVDAAERATAEGPAREEGLE